MADIEFVGANGVFQDTEEGLEAVTATGVTQEREETEPPVISTERPRIMMMS